MEQWAIWKNGNIIVFGSNSGLIPRMMDHMKALKCPKCLGTKRVKTDNYWKTKKKKDCPFCNGHGKINMAKPDGKVNPALISSTGKNSAMGSFVYAPEDPQSLAVDHAYSKLSLLKQAVIHVEYCSSGTQKEKANSLKICRKTYWTRLNKAQDFIYEFIQNIPNATAA